jgi:predicted metal-dependent peptidase
VYTDDDRIGKLNKTYKDLNKYRSVVLHETIKLGYPRFVDDLVPTAAVGLSPDGRLRYYWNRAFFDHLQIRDRVYVCAHEALHVILGHPVRRGDRHPYVWNIACDIVVNTLLDYQFNLHLNLKSTQLGNRVMAKNYNLLPDEALNMTTEEIYDHLWENVQFVLGPDGIPIPGAGLFDDHELWDTITEEAINKLRQQLDEKQVKAAGSGRGGDMRMLEKIIAKPFPWQQLLRGRLATVRRPQEHESWARPNRKIYSYFPDVLLPGAHEDELTTSRVLCTIDTSGSMSKESIRDLVAIVKSLPRNAYEVHLTWFDDGVYDANDLNSAKGGGGTSFQKIELTCRGEEPILGADDKEHYLKAYPDVIIAMTDGWAPRPDLLHPERWIWIIIENGDDSAIRDLGCTVWNLHKRAAV